MIPRRWALAAIVALYVCGGAVAHAQGRPYRALFGGSANDPTARQLLDASLSLAEAYDTNVLGRDGATNTAPALQVGGLFTEFIGDLRYTVRGRRAQLGANVGTNLRYFHQLNEVAALGHYLAIGVSLPLGKKTTLTVSESLSYRPSYLYGLFAKAAAPSLGQVSAPGANYVLTDVRSYTSATSASISHPVGQRVTLDFISGYRYTAFIGRGAGPQPSTLTSYDVGGAMRYGIKRDLGLRLGYTYRQAEYSLARRPTTHDIGLGLDYRRPLSRSRRTMLGVNAGTSVVDTTPLDQTTPGTVRQFRATGDVLLTHEIGRSWNARAAYRRSAHFVEELAAPVFADGVTLTLDGFLNRRTDVTSQVAYSAGDAFNSTAGGFKAYTGSVRMRLAIMRPLAAYAEYLYYSYDFKGAQLITSAPPRIDRHGVRVGITLWVPIFRK